MKVVLNQDIKGLGKKLQIVEVSEGYARNHLIPKKLANIADSKAINEAKTKNEAFSFKKAQDLEAAKKEKEIIEKLKLSFKLKVGEGGKLFGSVTEKEIAEKLNEETNILVNKRKITLKNPIKSEGEYEANVKLLEGVVASLKVVVIGE